MAIRNIRVNDDPILRKEAKEVTEITPRIQTLIDDMFDTMYDAEGVGLAAVQVGVLKQIVVIDTTGAEEEPEENRKKLVLINPVIVETEGEQRTSEGCLSFPGRSGIVVRPQKATVRALNRDGQEFVITGEGLLAKAFAHEIDHLHGIVYVDKVEEWTD